MTETTNDDASLIIKSKLEKGEMSWGDLQAVLGWTKGRLQHHVDLLEAKGEIFTKKFDRGDRKIKMVSLAPFKDEEVRENKQTAVEEANRDVERLQSTIIRKFLKATFPDIKEYLANYGITIPKDLPPEYMKTMAVGTIILEAVLKEMGFTGINDKRLDEILKGETND